MEAEREQSINRLSIGIKRNAVSGADLLSFALENSAKKAKLHDVRTYICLFDKFTAHKE